MSATGKLPTADEFFGSGPSGTLPTVDQFFAPPKPTLAQGAMSALAVAGSEMEGLPHAEASADMDDFIKNTPVGHVLDAFGQGFRQQWGTDAGTFPEEVSDWLKKAGLFHDYEKRRTGLINSFNEGIIRATYGLADMANRAIGGVVGGAEQAAYQTGIETGQPQLGHEAAAGIEYATQRGDILARSIPETTYLGGQIAKARGLAVIGEGEGGFFGTKEPTPETAAARAEAVKAETEHAAAQAKETWQPEPGAQGQAETPAQRAPQAPPEPTLDDIARQIAPQAFQQRDALAVREQTYRRWLRELGDARAQLPEVQELQGRIGTILDKVNGVEDRLTGKAAQRLSDARDRLDEIFRTDTGDMAHVRANLMEATHGLWDVAPRIRAAYEEAQRRLPPAPENVSVEQNVARAETSPEAQPATPAQPPEQAAAGQNVQPVLAAGPESGAAVLPGLPRGGAAGLPLPPAAAEGMAAAQGEGTGAPIGAEKLGDLGGAQPPAVPAQPQPSIATDVARKLVFAGRPQEEADAAGALLQAHYEARAARFNGALGTADQIYAREGPAIRRGRGLGPVPAPQPGQTAAAPAPKPADPTKAPSELESLDPAQIKVDPGRFQFKADTGERGISERLQGVEQWDPRLAGTALVWRDATGQDWIADGHQRLGLAQRLTEAGQPGIRLNAFVLNAAEGVSDADARGIAAAKNIAEGTGTAIDAAKVIREAKAKGIELPPMPPRSALVRDGRALARLSPEAFGMAVNDVVPTNQAAIVGRLVDDPLAQTEAMRVLAKTKPENARQAEMIVRDMLASGVEEMTKQGGLFGEEHFAASTVMERAKIADEAMRQLKRDKATFKVLVDEAARIEGHGQNVLDVEANKGRLTTDEQAAQFLTQLATRKGEVSDGLTAIAKRLKSGDVTAAAGAREFLGIVRTAAEKGLAAGPDLGRAESGPERDIELFQSGLKQTELPGLADETAAERKARLGRQLIEESRQLPRAVSRKAQKPLEEGLFAPPPERTLFQGGGEQPTFYSALTRSVEGLKLEKAPADQWLNTIRNIPGVKKEELEWSGVEDWLKEQKGPVTRAAVTDYLHENEVHVQEVQKGGPHGATDDEQGALEVAMTNAVNKGIVDNGASAKFYDDIVRGDSQAIGDAEAIGIPDSVLAPFRDRERAPTKFGPGSGPGAPLPGGANYRELLLTLPENPEVRRAGDAAADSAKRMREKYGERWAMTAPADEVLAHGGLEERRQALSKQNEFRASHWAEPNVLAHVRFDDRTGPNGEKVLHVAEIQSDWHQKGRKQGYEQAAGPEYYLRMPDGEIGQDFASREEGEAFIRDHPGAGILDRQSPNTTGVPNAPFKTSWPELAMKRMIRYAAENGYDRISWDTGDTNAERYDLSKQINEIHYLKRPDGRYDIVPIKNGHVFEGLRHDAVPEEKLPDILGKDVAKRIADGAGDDLARGYKKLTGDNLKVGGEGMRAFYDKHLPIIANKLGKKFGAKVEESRLGMPDDKTVQNEGTAATRAALGIDTVHSLPITDTMRDSVMEGQPLFQGKRGAIAFRDARATIRFMRDADSSTFLHETAHQWLEELIRDSRDRRAPPDVGADVGTVRDWYNNVKRNTEPEWKADGAVPDEAHELWARGFERYYREGAAPSQRLATIFAKFKAWLTKIYKTAEELHAPINDEIRAVYSRLLSTPEERAAIAPERPAPPTLADMHEEDAALTPAQHAGTMADVIRSEIDNRAKDVAPEVHNELPGKAETGRIQRENPPLPGGGDEAGPIPGENAGAGGTGAEPKGGNPIAAEGARPRGGAGGAGTKPPSGPNAAFERPESDLIDKAGNIRVDNLNTTADVDRLIHDVADENGGFAGVRIPMSDSQALDLADAMGLRPEDLNGTQLANFTRAHAFAVRKLFVSVATETNRAAAKAAAGGDADVLAYAAARSRMRMAQEHLSALTYAAGSVLRGFQKLPGTAEAKGLAQMMGDLSEQRSLFQLKQEAKRVARLDTPAKVSKYLRDQDTPGLGEMGLELFINNLISGPITHATYAVGNTMLALWKAVPETAAEALIGMGREALGAPPGQRAYMGEVGAQLYAMFGKGQRDGFRAAWDALKSGQTTALPGEVLDASNDLFSTTTTRPTTPFTSSKAIPNFEIGGVPVPVGSIVRAPGERMVAPIHSYYRTVGYVQAVAREAYRQAMNEGLTGDAFSARVADLSASPSSATMDLARHEATDQTMMGQGGELMRRLSWLLSYPVPFPRPIGPTRLLRFIDPFVQVFGSIMRETVIKRGLPGLLSDDMRGRNGPLAQNRAGARVAVGVSLSVVGAGLAAEGVLNSSAPSDPRARGLWTLVNGMPHSIRVGDLTFDLSRLGVLGMHLGIAADLYNVADTAAHGDMVHAGSLLVHSIAQNFLDEGFAEGISEMLKAVDDNDRYGQAWVRNFVKSFVPYAVGLSQSARMIDPYAREARTVTDSILAGIPFASESLEPRRDIWGEPIQNRNWALVYSQRIQDDPVNRELLGLGVFPAQPQRKIRGVAITDAQYDDLSRIGGRYAKALLDNDVRTPGWSSIPAEHRIEIIKKDIETARESARTTIMMSHYATAPPGQSIIDRAYALKLHPLQNAVGPGTAP
jgi:hypothetical protein